MDESVHKQIKKSKAASFDAAETIVSKHLEKCLL